MNDGLGNEVNPGDLGIFFGAYATYLAVVYKVPNQPSGRFGVVTISRYSKSLAKAQFEDTNRFIKLHNVEAIGPQLQFFGEAIQAAREEAQKAYEKGTRRKST